MQIGLPSTAINAGRLLRRLRPEIRPGFVVAAEAIVASVLSALYVGRHSLWFDEAVSAQLTRVPTHDFFSLIVGREANSAAYFGLLRTWAAVAGHSEASLRALSVVATVVTVAGIYLAGERLFSQRVGLIAGLLYAVSPGAVLAAQEARGFALETCLLVLSVVAFANALESERQVWWFVWSVLAIAAGAVHFLAMLVPVALVATLIVFGPKTTWRPALAGLTITFLAIAPLVLAGIHGGQGTLLFLQGATARNARALPRTIAGGSSPLTLFFVVTGGAACFFWVRRLRRSTQRGELLSVKLTLAWLAVPVLLALVISVFKPVFNQHYFTFELAPLVLLVASASEFVSRKVTALGVSIGIVLSVFGLAHVYSQPARQNWRAATHLVLTNVHRGDEIVFAPTYLRVPFEYYREQSARPTQMPTPAVPASPWGPTPLEDFPLVRTAVQDSSKLLDGTRVWLVKGSTADRVPPTQTDVFVAMKILRDEWRLRRKQAIEGVTVRLYERRGGN
jgi:mannosyltransferase